MGRKANQRIGVRSSHVILGKSNDRPPDEKTLNDRRLDEVYNLRHLGSLAPKSSGGDIHSI